MPFYTDLKPPAGPEPAPALSKAELEAERERTIARILALREALATEQDAPPPRTFGTLLLATWNLREFDAPTWGSRLRESYAYIAEIIDRFDLVALQEVREDLGALKLLLGRLGPDWDFIASDVTEGKPGNRERLVFLYDRRKVRFLGVAGELVLPPVQTAKGAVPATQVARTPLMAAFQVGWTKFLLTTVHIIYGDDSAEPAARVEEISQVGRFLRKRADDPIDLTGNMLLLGDFNIFTKGDKTYEALVKDGGFTIPAGIDNLSGSDVGLDKKYDQIAYRAGPTRFRETGRAGVVKYYEHVFTDTDADVYRPYIDRYIQAQHQAGKTSPKAPTSAAAALTQYRTWRTYQMSDHYPLWAEFQVDFSDDYLRSIAAVTPAPAPAPPPALVPA
ncbi:MAG TPA: endonuclease/exonuclease/phosphatase family protein [Gaiellaceae bacterium]|nr:endonuclease/exonuclease/phosphatase family protein [Gaiellaceae bacterium]